MLTEKLLASAFVVGFATAITVSSLNLSESSSAPEAPKAAVAGAAYLEAAVAGDAEGVGNPPLFSSFIGTDLNNSTNTFVQPTNPALSGGGRDQSLQFHDVVSGNPFDISVLIGLLGEDILAGGSNIDFIIGGPEHFNPRNRDKAFGFNGDDVFIWKPGDGSDFFDGGAGDDTIIFGLIGEDDGSGTPDFSVSNNQLAGQVFLDNLGLPVVDVTNSPGFCKVIDSATDATSAQGLFDLGLTHIVQFFIRGINQSFNAGTQTTDNGLRVSLHLKSVEYLVCTDPNGGQIAAFDLRTTPPTSIPVTALPFAVQFIIR